MTETIAAPPGWYFVRVGGGPGMVNGMVRYPIAAWRLTAGAEGRPLLAKPGRPGLVAPSAEDEASLVGFCPPEREWQSFFASQDIEEASQRLALYLRAMTPTDREAQKAPLPRSRRASLYEVDAPGIGPVPVRDERPQGQVDQDDADHWTKKVLRDWRTRGDVPSPRLPGS